MPTLLFICTGNICRSPMAAEFFRKRAQDKGDVVNVESAGTWGVDGQPASLLAREVLAARGLNLDGHIARTVTREMIEKADLILVMTRNHRDALVAEFPFARRKMRLLSQVRGMEYDIADPYGKARQDYELCANDLQELIERGYAQILEWLAQSAVSLPNAQAQLN